MTDMPFEAWHDLFVAGAGAAAALAGLLFVAVSINITRVLQIPGLPGRAGEGLVFLMSMLVVSLLGLIPEIPVRVLGLEIAALGIGIGVMSLVLQLRTAMAGGQQPYWIFTRALFALIATLPWIVCGVLLILGAPSGMYWIPVGMIACLFSGVSDSWYLLVEILR